MLIVLCRHGSWEKVKEEPLSKAGRNDVQQLAEMLDAVRLKPTRYFSSSKLHARQTTELLRDKLTPHLEIAELACLTPSETPGDRAHGIEAFANQAQETRRFERDDVVLVVGHEPRLGRLLASMTGTAFAQLGRVEAVCVSGSEFRRIALGVGEIDWRWSPVRERKADLGPKLTSKMSVSGVLAGLTFTAVTILLGSQSISIWRLVAVLLLTAAAALFVASLYAYDRLQMPEVFWDDGHAGTEKRKPFGFADLEKDREKNGQVYAEMVWTWKFVFSPALALATCGYIAALADLRVDACSHVRSIVRVPCDFGPITAGAAIALVMAVYYWRAKPRLAVD